MATLTAQEYNDNRKAYRKAVLRRTRNAGTGWYEVLRNSNAYYLRRLGAKMRNGREEYLYNRLSEGWLPFRRFRRYTDTDGNKKTTKDLVAVPPNYKFRQVEKKPGWT